MPLTVITLKNVPVSLRGDLTKWLQEISTGVFVGNINSKIRENLWKRIEEGIGVGEASVSYQCRNEIGYDFKMINSNRKSIDYDGIPLVIIPNLEIHNGTNIKYGFSDAAKFRKINAYNIKNKHKYIVLDIETDGIDENTCRIIEIAAIKINGNNIEEFNYLIKNFKKLPKYITELTGITDSLLENKGENLKNALEKLLIFLEDFTLVGYNINFDLNFLNYNLKKLNLSEIKNDRIDLLRFVKKEKLFLNSYKLEDVLQEYGLDEKQKHRALDDSKAIYKLSRKVNGFLSYIDKK